MVAPFCDRTRSVLLEVAKELGMRWHDRGTVVTIEGPRFSSKAESEMFRLWGCDVVNMTSVPEVVLAKEAAICYAAVGLPTDYDCWRNEPVGVAGWTGGCGRVNRWAWLGGPVGVVKLTGGHCIAG